MLNFEIQHRQHLNQVNASNNAGDRPYQWAANMGQQAVMAFLVEVSAQNPL